MPEEPQYGCLGVLNWYNNKEHDMLEHHPLIKEFPELKSQLHDLKDDNHFSKIMAEYDELDKKVFRLESTGEFQDVDLENLKKERLILKDVIYSKLKK